MVGTIRVKYMCGTLLRLMLSASFNHSPYYFILYLGWLVRWYWKFSIKKEEYGDEEKAYIMRKKMGLSQIQWDVSFNFISTQNSIRSYKHLKKVL